METFEKCMKKLSSPSSSDSEKLASMMVISKLSPSIEFDQSLSHRLYEAIGSKFLVKLLQSDHTNTIEFKYIAVLVLNCIVKQSPSIISNNERLFGEIIKLLSSDMMNDANSQMFVELFEIIQLLSTQCEYFSLFLKHNVVLKLEKFLLLEEFSDKSLSILSNLFVLNGDKSTETLLALFLNVSKDFKMDQELRKFKLLELLIKLMDLVKLIACDFKSRIEYEQVLNHICFSSRDILLSKCKPYVKRQVIQLLSTLSNIFGIQFLFSSQLENNQRFILSLLTVASIETALAYYDLKECNLEVSSKLETTIISCLTISKKVIGYVCSDDFTETSFAHQPDFIIKVFKCLKNILTSTYQFVNTNNNNDSFCLDQPVVLHSVLLICLWATEETETLQDELKTAIPTILSLAQQQMQDIHIKTDGPTTTRLIDYMLPCLSQIFPDPTFTPIFVKSECLKMYAVYFKSVTSKASTDKVEQVENIEALVHFLFQGVLILPSILYPLFEYSQLTHITRFVNLQISLEGSLYYKLELTALYFNLLRNISLSNHCEEHAIEVLKAFCQLTGLHLVEDCQNMWIIALQNIIDCIKSNRLEPPNDQMFTTFIKEHKSNTNNEQQLLVSEFQRCITI